MKEEIDKFIQELRDKVNYLVELKIDKERDEVEWGVREKVIYKIQHFEEELRKLKEDF